MSFLDSQGDAAEEGGPPSTPPPQAGAPTGGPPGGGPVLAALANRQRPGPRVSAPGPGDTAHSMTMLTQGIGLMKQAIPGLPAGSPLLQDVLRALSRIERHLAQGQPTAGVQRTQLQDLLQNLMKNALVAQIMGQQKKQQGGQGGGQGGQPGAAPAPMPSTPLPGA